MGELFFADLKHPNSPNNNKMAVKRVMAQENHHF
jgi:hypothetical protein